MVKRLALLGFAGILALGIGIGAQEPEKKYPIDPVKPPVVKVEQANPVALQEATVTIRVGNEKDGFEYGTGVVKNRDGVVFILTCAHAVSALKECKFEQDVQVLKDVSEDGRIIGLQVYDAEVIAYSEKEDLAILRVRKKNAFTKSVVFSKKSDPVPIGAELCHVGSFHGIRGSDSFSTGVVSRHGRVRGTSIFDQSTCTIFPGSSGGGVFLKSNGEYVGMVVRAGGETYNLYIPMRRIYAWADRIGAGFVFDDQIPVPEGLKFSSPAEEQPPKPDEEFDTNFPTLLKKVK